MAPATSGPGDASAGVKYEFGYTSRLLTGADVVATRSRPARRRLPAAARRMHTM